MDSLPWPAITAASGGWVLFGLTAWLVIRKIVAGDLVPSRVVDAVTKRAELAESTNEVLLEQNSELLRANRVGTSLMESLGKAVE